MADASRIDCIDRSPAGDIVAFAGMDAAGGHWMLSRHELIAAIESGQRAFYVTFAGHSHLVALRREPGRKVLATFLGELEDLALPLCR